ncbi:glycoside hydrolase family 3 C-terminal domain-containing protein [Streptomyces sp. cg35]|uniref:glycoside hydrolase family 3 C-terminal domain-containing protein n=1 Tax=Streptomyces sp. cg35 TaxID=3421650 RepID=UPI003D183DFE
MRDRGQHDPAPPSPRRLSLGWQQPDTEAVQKSVEAAKKADTAVVVVNDNEGEDADRQNLTLPGAQDDLVAAVARANPNTVVVLNTGGPVLMPWLHSVRSIVESWYGGQENGAALASVLFGDVDPSGRLPQTWPTSMSQLPTADHDQYPGVVDPDKDSTTYRYSEKLDVGHRGYDADGKQPEFPFGHGLSYSSFAYSDLRIAHDGDGHGGLRVTATVKNTGARTASDVAQLYVGFPEGSGEPTRQLKAFAKVALQPGRSRRVTMTVPADRLRMWDTSTHGWKSPHGAWRVEVGNSSRNLPLTGKG